MHALKKFETRNQREEYNRMMWLVFLLQSNNPNPDIDGMYDLRTMNDAPNRNWTKPTPYSPAQAKHA